MALPKITDIQIQESGVQSLPDKLTGTAAQNKQKFDQLVQNVVKIQYNALIDALEASGGAGEIGANVNGIEASTVQGVLSALKTLIDNNKQTQDTTNSGVQNSLDNVYTKSQTDAKVKVVQDDVDANESAQNAVNTNVQTALGNRYTKTETDNMLDLKLDEATGEGLVKNIEFNSDTGVFTITTLGGKTTTIDTLLEKVPASFSLSGSKLILTLEDGTKQEADLSAFIDTYTFTDTTTIDFSQSGKNISAAVKNGSITKTKLASEVLQTVEEAEAGAIEAKEDAEAAKTSAETYADLAQGYKTAAAESATAAESSETAANSYANVALNSKNAAQESASAAATSAGNAARSETNAANSEKNAADSATAAAGSASSAEASETNVKSDADRADKMATRAESWAVGGTGLEDRADEDENNAMYYATKARRYAVGDTETEAGEEASNAKYYAERAGLWTMGTSHETNNPDDTHNASYYAQRAEAASSVISGSASAAAESASAAKSSAYTAAESAATASDKADQARYWAVGYHFDGNGPSDTNNAKYWAEVAKSNANSEQADWSEADENMAGYVKNRTHYEHVLNPGGVIMEETALVFGSVANFIYTSNLNESMITEGETYYVTWGTTKYTCVAKTMTSDADTEELCLGNASLASSTGEDSGEPFCFWDFQDSACVSKAETSAETITCKIEGERNVVIKQLDPKYIKDMYYKETVEGETIVDMEKTFGVLGLAILVANTTNPFTEGEVYEVTWGEDTYQLECFVEDNNYYVGNPKWGAYEGEDNGLPFCIYYEGDSLWAKNDKTAVTVKIKVVSHDKTIYHKIAKEYLPDDVPHVTSEVTEIFPETALTYVEDAGGFVLENSIGLEAGKIYNVTWNGVEYSRTAYEISVDVDGSGILQTLGCYLGNYSALGGMNTGETWLVADFNELGKETQGVGAIMLDYTGSTEATMGITEEKETIYKLDNRCLDVDWYAKDGRIVLIAEQTVEFESIENSIGCYTIPCVLEDGKEYVLKVNGTEYIGGAADNQVLCYNDAGELAFGYTLTESEETIVGMFVAFNYTETEATIEFSERDFEKLPEKYLPESVVPTAQVQSDWGQTDETAVDFIKNKPTILANILDGAAVGSIRTVGAMPDSGENLLGEYAFAEGSGTTAKGKYSHAEGYFTKAGLAQEDGTIIGNCSHAEGYETTASSESSHAEGFQTVASGFGAHAEGSNTTASAGTAHAEGDGTVASSFGAHAEGNKTIATSYYQHVQGRYNIEDTEGKYAHIVGNGTSTARSNAHTVDWDGNAWYAGTVEGTALILTSPGGKRFKITVDDSGALTATEITE